MPSTTAQQHGSVSIGNYPILTNWCKDIYIQGGPIVGGQ